MGGYTVKDAEDNSTVCFSILTTVFKILIRSDKNTNNCIYKTLLLK